MALDFLGISPALLTLALIGLGIILLLAFTFIFLGIEAFALGGTFGAIINSLMPMAAGGSAASSQELKKEDKEFDDIIAEAVSKT